MTLFVWPGTTIDALPLPSGAATSTKQDTIIGHVDGLESSLTSLVNKTSGALVPVSFDSITANYGGATTNVYTYKQGLTTVATLTVTYTDTTKAVFSSVVRT